MNIVSPFLGFPICRRPLSSETTPDSEASMTGDSKKGSGTGGIRVGGESRHSKDTGKCAQRNIILIFQDLNTPCCGLVEQRVFRPIQCSRHNEALLVFRVTGFVNTSNSKRTHRFADFERLIVVNNLD